MSKAIAAPDVIQGYADHVAAGEYKKAISEAESLTQMDCDLCTRVGVFLMGLGYAAESSFSDEAERMLTQIALSRADGLAEKLSADGDKAGPT